MKAVIQRVKEASVTVEGQILSKIGKGLLVLLGIKEGDGDSEIQWLAQKIVSLRIFSDDNGKMNRSLVDCGGSMLIVSQFTLYGDCRKGRRPGFSQAAPPEAAKLLYEKFIQEIESLGISFATGIFQADMDVALTNDGPVTFVIDTHHLQG